MHNIKNTVVKNIIFVYHKFTYNYFLYRLQRERALAAEKEKQQEEAQNQQPPPLKYQEQPSDKRPASESV